MNSASLYIAGNNSNAGGTGSLLITNSGTVDVAGTTKLWNAGTLTVDGGTLNTTNLDRTLGTVNHHDGTIKVNGGLYSQPAQPLIISGNTTTALPSFQLTVVQPIQPMSKRLLLEFIKD